MPIFNIRNNELKSVKPTKFKKEKELQALVENSLDELFNCRFVSTEFSTGSNHAGRIDTLALSEENNPVIIEYKVVESSDLINQSLFYLSWIMDHRGDFQVLVNDVLGKGIKVDWSEIRVICIAPGYKKYDLHAVTMMGANIELWKYRLYENKSFQLDEIYRRGGSPSRPLIEGKNPIMVEAGKKAAETRRTGVYTFNEHVESKSETIREIVDIVRQFALDLDDGVEENPKKQYVAYKTTKNFLCMEIQNRKVLLFLKLKINALENPPRNGRDVTNIGHFGTGNYELTLKSVEDAEKALVYVEESFGNIGG